MLKKSLIILSAIAITVITVCSCTLETSSNGDLDGAWHLLRINDKDVEQPNIYWNIQGKMLELREKVSEHDAFILRFKHENGKLSLNNPYVYDREDGDKPLEDPTPLNYFGIYNLEETFDVITLTHSRMTLKSSTVKLDFRKF